MIENRIKDWAAGLPSGKYLISELTMMYAQWCMKEGYDCIGVTSHTISRVMGSLGYERYRHCSGIMYIVDNVNNIKGE